MRLSLALPIPLLALAALGCSLSAEPAADRAAVGTSSQALTCVAIQRAVGAPGQILDASIVMDPAKPSAANQNFGSATLTITGGVGTSVRRSLMHFDLSAIPTGSVLTSATLTMFMNQSPGQGALDLHEVLAPWSESTVTWNLLGSSFDPNVALSIPTAGIPNSSPLIADITGLVSAWVSGATPNYGVLIDHPSAGKTTFGSSEAGSTQFRPKLDVCYADPTCSDGIQNQGETDVDCGGPCGPCDCAGWVTVPSPAVADIAYDSAGNRIVVGAFTGTIDLGSGPITAQLGPDSYVAKYDANDQLLWVAPSNISSSEGFSHVGVDAAGNTYAGGIDFGTGSFLRAYLRAYAPDGSLLWASPYQFGGGSTWLGDMVVDAAGNSYLTGTVGSAGYAAKISPTGAVIWQRTFQGSLIASSIAIDAAGDAVVVGQFQGTITAPTFTLTSASPSTWDIYAIKYRSGPGAVLWSKAFGGTGSEVPTAVAADAAGDFVLTGWFDGTLDFGGGALPFAGGAEDMFLAKLSTSGAHVWSRSFGSANTTLFVEESGYELSIGAGNEIWLAGVALGTIDYGKGPVYAPTESAHLTSLLVASFDSLGGNTSARVYPGAYSLGSPRLSLAPDGAPIVRVDSDYMDFGTGPLVGYLLAKLPCLAADCGAGSCSGGAYCDSCGCKDPADALSLLACGCGSLDPTCGEGTCSAGFYCEKNHCGAPTCYPPSSDVARAMCTGGAIDGTCSVTGGTKRVFLSSTPFTGDLGGVAGGDAKCQALATAAGLTGTYAAWLSSNDAAPVVEISPFYTFSRFDGAYELVDASVVANNWYELIDGRLDHAIDLTELFGGADPSAAACGAGRGVWTNTATDSEAALWNDCSEWTDVNASNGLAGSTGSAVGWTQDNTCFLSCSSLAHLYCFEQ